MRSDGSVEVDRSDDDVYNLRDLQKFGLLTDYATGEFIIDNNLVGKFAPLLDKIIRG